MIYEELLLRKGFIMNHLEATTVRLPASLKDQIDQRADIMRRSRNAEIISLLEFAIDEQSKRDIDILSQYNLKQTK